MSIKRTKIFYPHIVKQYESIAQLVSENGYDDFYAAIRQEVADANIDLNDSAVYRETLSEDGFEGIVTVKFESQEAYEAYVESCELHEGRKRPIYVEESDNHLF